MDAFCGIDWAEDHHDIAVVDRDGTLLARARISDDAAGVARLLELLAGHGDSAGDPIPVAIETPRGLLVACLRAAGRDVYPVNPMAVARYRDRHSIAGRKSDRGDAVVLANVLSSLPSGPTSPASATSTPNAATGPTRVSSNEPATTPTVSKGLATRAPATASRQRSRSPTSAASPSQFDQFTVSGIAPRRGSGYRPEMAPRVPAV